MPEKIIKSIIVKGSIGDIYALWENFENFSSFMKDIKSVRKTGEKKSHWIMKGPLGKDLEWDAQTTELQPNTRIAWNSISGDITTSGQVTFTDLDRNGVQVNVQMQYIPPAGELGKIAAHLLDNPDKRVEEDLKQFKQYAEERFTSVRK